MIVLAESNFVLELALQQEQSEEAQRVVDLAEARRLELIIPACCFAEPCQTLIRRRRERSALSRRLQSELQQLSRSKSFVGRSYASRDLPQMLAAGDDAESKGLQDTIDGLIRFCTVHPLTSQVIHDAQRMQVEFGLGPHDALVFASIDAALRGAGEVPKVFINKDSKDFAKFRIRDHLRRYECKLLTDFAAARRFVESALAKAAARERPSGA